MNEKPNFFQKIGPFFRAIRIRLKSEMPKFFQTINTIANAVLGLAASTNTNVLDLINGWLSTGLHPLPWLSDVSKILVGVGVGAKFVAMLTANLTKLSETQIEKINPTQPEIAEKLTSK